MYLGRDTKLDREVAIKILPDALAQDPERLARFEREAKVLASLNHPNIAQIYGVEESSGVRALVMELVPGQTLAEAEKTPLPLEIALTYARQIAEALEAAHEKGIVHRDLKPANVMITPAGVVKVLDFGLAAMPSRDGAGADPQNSPTFTMAATQAGFILGTAGYMAPEQAAGKPVDKRADIWAFGVVLYEMLTGGRLFEGETVSHTLADVLRAPIDFGKLRKDTPPAIRNLLERCLDRNVKNRLRDIGEARVIIDRVGKEPVAQQAAMVPGASATGGKAAWAIAGLCILATITLAWIHFRETAPPRQVARFQIALPENTSNSIFELSPDGRTLAFTASEGGRRRLWVRPIDSLTAQPVPGTDDATYLFWSPDSTNIGFFVSGKLKKVALSGGPAQTLCDASGGRGGSWNQDGVIVFSPGLGLPLQRVSAAGGTPAPVTKLGAPSELQRYPTFLPHGKRFLFEITNARPGMNGLYAGSLDASPPVRVLADESSAAYVASSSSDKIGLLLFRRDGTLMAQPFDPGTVRSTGDAFPVAEQVGISGNTDHASFSVSGNGTLAYGGGGISLLVGLETGNLEWADRNGKRTSIGQAADILTQALSPDGKQVALCIRTQGGDGADLWILDVARGVPSRFTFRPGRSMDAVWSPDGGRIIFQGDNTAIYQKSASGAGKEELLLAGGLNVRPQDWSRDGRYLAYMDSGGKTGTDLWLLPLEGDHKPIPYLQTPFNESDAQFSPDGRWMAYTSNESGPPQVYVQSIPASGTKFQISSAGGVQPRWRRDGKELFYLSTDNKLMAVPMKIGETVEAGPSTVLFEIRPIYAAFFGLWAYEPTADGKRFLVMSSKSGANRPITVVVNWQAGIKR